MLDLVAPTQEVFDRWFEESAERQAGDRAWVSGRDPTEERARLDAMIPSLLPEGKESPGHVFRVARAEDGSDVAFVWFGAPPGMPANMKLLFDICVAPEHRRRGYARAILTEMLAQLASEGATAVALNARGDNAPALALYESLGFVRTETSDDGKQVEMLLELGRA